VCLECLAVTHILLGGVRQAQGDLAGALESHRAALALREDLAKNDPNGTGWLRRLSEQHSQIGAILRQQRNLAGALESYKAGLAIDQRLASTEPKNATWQHYLRVSYTEVGGVLEAQTKHAAALESYQAALAIAEQAVAADPRNTQGLRNLMGAHRLIADVQVAKGDRVAALASFRKALDSMETEAKVAEEDEIKRQGKAAGVTAAELGNVAWQALFARNFARALAASERARALAPDLLWPETNHAHALMFLDRTREAKALYLAHKGKSSNDKPWEEAITNDFAQLRKAGLNHRLMSEVETQLGVKRR
jgi:tetratricopeptide (TPR) repeat protein